MNARLDLQPHDGDEARATISRLLAVLGQPGTCKGCNARIVWMHRLTSGKLIPYDLDGIAHFATCPDAKTFRRESS